MRQISLFIGWTIAQMKEVSYSEKIVLQRLLPNFQLSLAAAKSQ